MKTIERAGGINNAAGGELLEATNGLLCFYYSQRKNNLDHDVKTTISLICGSCQIKKCSGKKCGWEDWPLTEEARAPWCPESCRWGWLARSNCISHLTSWWLLSHHWQELRGQPSPQPWDLDFLTANWIMCFALAICSKGSQGCENKQ